MQGHREDREILSREIIQSNLNFGKIIPWQETRLKVRRQIKGAAAIVSERGHNRQGNRYGGREQI